MNELTKLDCRNGAASASPVALWNRIDVAPSTYLFWVSFTAWSEEALHTFKEAER